MAVRADTAALGCIVDPADPRLRILACPGQPGCGAATVDTGADVARLLAAGGVFRDLLHVSGCAKGCAHPGPAALTLVGEAGRYGLVRGGTARQPPERSGLTIEQAAVLLGGFQETA
jgi:precorrin-3B synthase